MSSMLPDIVRKHTAIKMWTLSAMSILSFFVFGAIALAMFNYGYASAFWTWCIIFLAPAIPFLFYLIVMILPLHQKP